MLIWWSATVYEICCSSGYRKQSCYQGLALIRGQGQDFFLKANAKDIRIFQGQLSQLPLRTKICIAVAETEYAYFIKHNAKESICGGFAVFNVENYPSQATWAHRAALISVSIALSTSLHCEASDSGLSTFRYTACLITTHLPTDEWPSWVDLDGWLNNKTVLTWMEPVKNVTHASTKLTWRGVSTLIETVTILGLSHTTTLKVMYRPTAVLLYH